LEALESLVEQLNRDCFCIGADLPELRQRLETELRSRGVLRPLVESHPHLFSVLSVFVSRAHVDRMLEIVGAIESVIGLSEFRRSVLDAAPEIARFDAGPLGVFMGFDFHLGIGGPQLIEINTNAGGALLNALLGSAQRACCAPVERLLTGPIDAADLEERIFEMFLAEWRLTGRTGRPQRIAIVDDDPASQYLYPEFLLFERLFESRGIDALIADAADLEWRDRALWLADHRIDVVYNRLTDFYFEQSSHTALRVAYLEGATVVTPHPRAHALYANKHNLALLTDANALRRFGASERTIAMLVSGVARTRPVVSAERDALWRDRKRLFFKPATGYGGRGAYRGDKLTRGTFELIIAGDYVAQSYVAPSERRVSVESDARSLRVDVRNYAYAGEVQLLAARLYHGQTTNFRSPGGGFAPVFYPPA
jgi:hypothetical protein